MAAVRFCGAPCLVKAIQWEYRPGHPLSQGAIFPRCLASGGNDSPRQETFQKVGWWAAQRYLLSRSGPFPPPLGAYCVRPWRRSRLPHLGPGPGPPKLDKATFPLGWKYGGAGGAWALVGSGGAPPPSWVSSKLYQEALLGPGSPHLSFSSPLASSLIP